MLSWREGEIIKNEIADEDHDINKFATNTGMQRRAPIRLSNKASRLTPAPLLLTQEKNRNSTGTEKIPGYDNNCK